jgi:hypothetical protein
MANNRKDCPQHTTGNGPCYCQYNKDTNNVYHAPEDVKQTMRAINKILRGKISKEITPYIAARIRRENVEFIRSRVNNLSGDNQKRAFETINNLCE